MTTTAELKLMRDLIRTIRASARGNGILGPAALNLCNAVEALAADHGRVLVEIERLRAKLAEIARDKQAGAQHPNEQVQSVLCAIVETMQRQDWLNTTLRHLDWCKAGMTQNEFLAWWYGRQAELARRDREERS